MEKQEVNYWGTFKGTLSVAFPKRLEDRALQTVTESIRIKDFQQKYFNSKSNKDGVFSLTKLDDYK